MSSSNAVVSRIGESLRCCGVGVLDLVAPRICECCGGDADREDSHICWTCHAATTLVEAPFCSVCGNPAFGCIQGDYTCPSCGKRPPEYDRARSAVHFSGSVTNAIHAFKYDSAVYLALDFANLLYACVNVHYDRVLLDVVVPVPLHRAKERERGYNQSHLLATELASRLELPIMSHAIARDRHTPTQTGLTTPERRKNVRGAFSVPNPAWVDGKRILLVDDVMTTGATVNECAKVLFDAGAAAVSVVTVARGVPK